MPHSYPIMILSPVPNGPVYQWNVPNRCLWSIPNFNSLLMLLSQLVILKSVLLDEEHRVLSFLDFLILFIETPLFSVDS